MNVSCVWVSTQEAASISTIGESFFLAKVGQGGSTYYAFCGGIQRINVTLADAISAANGGDPIG